MFENLDIRGRLVCLTGAWQRMLDGRGYPEDIVSLLGHTTALNTLLGANQKGAGRVTLQVQGTGPVKLLVADCTAELRIRGMAHYRKDDIPQESERSLLGDGRLSVTLEDLKSGKFYQSLVPLEGETLEQIFAHYLSQSEQLTAYLRLHADGGALAGLLLEKLPNADTRDPDGWNRVTHFANTLTLEDTRGVQPYDLLTRLLPEPPPPPKPVAKAPEPTPAPVAAAPKPEVKPEPPKPDPNKELAGRVKQALEAPGTKLPTGAIDVTAADGKVTLWGAVASDAER